MVPGLAVLVKVRKSSLSLSLFFSVIQLDYTHDPIADFINAVQSDVIAFGSQRR